MIANQILFCLISVSCKRKLGWCHELSSTSCSGWCGSSSCLEGWYVFRSQSLLLGCGCYPDRISYQSLWLKDMMGDVEKWSLHVVSEVTNEGTYISALHIESESRLIMPNSLWPHELHPARLLCLWDLPGKNTGVGCHFLLQGSFPTQGSNRGLLHCRQILYWLSYQRKPQTHHLQHIEDTHKGALGRPRGIGWRGRWEGGSGWGTHVNLWLIHFNVWQNPLQ